MYVDDPSEVPGDKEVHEGEDGGTYYFSGSGEEEGEDTSDDSDSSDISRDPDDYRRVALGDVEIEEGTLLDFDGEVLQVEGVEGGSATGIYGANAGYAVLEDGTYASLNGDRPETMEEVLLEDVPDEQIRALTGADALEEKDPEVSGSGDVDDWSVEWSEVQYNNHGGDDAGENDRDLVRLDDDQKRRFKNEWESSAPEEGVSEVENTLRTIKGSTMNTRGQHYDKLVKETFGVAGDPREGDFDDAEEPSEAEVEAMQKFAEASQKFAEETFGEEFTIHRGLGTHAKESVMEAAASWYLDDADETFEMRDNPASVWTSDDKMADSYSKNLQAHREISSDEVMAMPEALLDFEAGRGPDWNEGEVNVAGWDMEVTPDDFTVTSSHGDYDVTLREAMENPVETFYEHDAGEEAFNNLATAVSNHGPPELAYELHKEIMNHRGYDSDNEDMSHAVSRLEEASREVINADEKSQVIDVRGESEWLSEAAREWYDDDEQGDGDDDDPDSDMDKFVKAATSVLKDWVQDPTEQAPNRWTNTQTGEHRYQEEKPAPGAEGQEGPGDDESDEADGTDEEFDPNEDWVETFDMDGQTFDDISGFSEEEMLDVLEEGDEAVYENWTGDDEVVEVTSIDGSEVKMDTPRGTTVVMDMGDEGDRERVSGVETALPEETQEHLEEETGEDVIPDHVEVESEPDEEALEHVEEYGHIESGDHISWEDSHGSSRSGEVMDVSVDSVGNFRVDVELDGGGETAFVPSFGSELDSVGNEEEVGEETTDDNGGTGGDADEDVGGDPPPLRGFDNYAEEYQENLNETLDDLAEDGHLEHVDRIKEEPDLTANGIYRYSVRGGQVDGTIEIRNVTDFWGRDGYMEEEQAEMYEAEGLNSTANPFHTIIHEVGHASHLGGMNRAEYNDVEDIEMSRDEKQIAEEEVSDQAAKNHHEFVAEVFAMKYDGQDVSDEVQDIYERYGGPEL